VKLGIIEQPGEQGFRHAAEFGLSFVEYCIDIGKDVSAFASQAGELGKYSARYNVAVGAIGRWGADKLDENGGIIEEELQNSYRLIDVCSQLGAGVFNTGVNKVKGISDYANVTAAIRFLEKLCDYGEKKGVRIATYNCDWANFVHSDWSWTLIHGHLPQLGIKFDSSHSIYAHRDYLAEMKKWGGRFYHVHIKGALQVDGQRFDDPPAGMDITNWGAFMGCLYAHGYDGLLSLEPHSRIWKEGELGDKGIALAIETIRKYILR
jgi:sugar phosphate isomerase/epimerase